MTLRDQIVALDIEVEQVSPEEASKSAQELQTIQKLFVDLDERTTALSDQHRGAILLLTAQGIRRTLCRMRYAAEYIRFKEKLAGTTSADERNREVKIAADQLQSFYDLYPEEDDARRST